MYLLIFVLTILTACQGGAPPKPAQPLDPKNATSLLDHAIHNTRSQTSYETTFQSRAQKAGSAPIDYKGSAVWVAPQVLYVQYTASGGDHKKIVRAGDSAWVYHTLVDDWVSDAEAGMAGAGKGIQNPDDILAAAVGHTAEAKLVEPGLAELKFTGQTLAKILKGQGNVNDLDWDKSSATLRIRVDDQTRVKQLTVDAVLQTKGEKPESLTYTAQVDVAGYGGARELIFEDEKKRPVPLSKEIQGAIQKVMKEKR